MNRQPELTVEQFKQKSNNFHCHFIRGSDDYRLTPHFLQFQQANPQLEQRLTDDFTPAWKEELLKTSFDNIMERFYPRFYEAYKLIRVYVERDRILFI